VKKETEQVKKDMEQANKKNEWLRKMNTYNVTLPNGASEVVVADGYIVGEYKWHEPQSLVFFIRMGDELVETARFKDWLSVSRDILSFYQEKSP